MKIRANGAFALPLLLLLTSLLEATGHELLCRDEPSPAGTTAASGPQVATAEAEQDRECPCCRQSGPRVSLGRPSATDPTLVAAEVLRARSGVLFVKPLPASHPSRGPPSG